MSAAFTSVDNPRCFGCDHNKIVDMRNKRDGLRCTVTNRITDTYPAGHPAAVETHEAPAWCPKRV